METDRAIDDYINAFSEPIRDRLKELRATIKAAAPGATERISYKMPSFYLHGNLVYYAGYVSHIALYGTSSVDAAMAQYKSGKGTLQFAIDAPLPVEAITEVVRLRVVENEKKARGLKKEG